MRIRTFACSLAVLLGLLRVPPPAASAQIPPKVVEMTLPAYLRAVADSNLAYAAQRYNVPIAAAQLAEARVLLPNPQLQFDYSGDVTKGRPRSERESAVKGIGLSQVIELGGKRGARVDAAHHALLAASATLDDFWRNLESAAASAFIAARVDQLIAARMKLSAESFDRVVEATRRRSKAGDVGEIDAIQARVDALQFRSQYLNAEANARAALIALAQFLGRDQADATIEPKADLDVPLRAFDLDKLVALALEKRPDVVAARENRDSAIAAMRLARAGRIPDPDIGIGYTRTGASNNPTAPYDRTDTLGVSLSFELPAFPRHQPELDAARSAAEQADREFDSALQSAQVQVRQAFAAYELAGEQVGEYRGRGALGDAETVLRARTFSYEHGDASLLDLLQAQRDLNDVYTNYYAALAGYVGALISLEQAAGIWDVSP